MTQPIALFHERQQVLIFASLMNAMIAGMPHVISTWSFHSNDFLNWKQKVF